MAKRNAKSPATTPAERPKAEQDLPRISRRDFARSAALAAATVATLPGEIFAGPKAAAVGEEMPVGPAQQSSEEAKLSPESRAEIEARIEAIFRKYGQRLNEEQKADVRRLARELQKPLEALRAFPLDNADAPATPLKIFPDTPAGAASRLRPRAPAPKGKAD